MNAIIKGTFLLLFVLLVGHTLRAQDTRRMYFGFSLEPTWSMLNLEMPHERGLTRFGVNINLQSLKYIKQWVGVYFGLSLLNNGGRIRVVDDNSSILADDIVCRFQYLALPLGIALTTPLKRNVQVNFQLGVAAALNIDGSITWGNDVGNIDDVRTFSPFYQGTLSVQYHIGQDVYLHLGPSYIRSMTSITKNMEIIQQSFGIRAGIIF
ncbi:MAG: PorT family protein [Prevotellaceae bacterium]|jgi:hypothetical protein|nr:PorT family protein [Prevotellaceae bacterium]